MRGKDITPSGLPSFLLPCPHCGHRMHVISVVAARIETGSAANDLEDVTHACVQCGTTLSRIVRPLHGFTSELVRRI